MSLRKFSIVLIPVMTLTLGAPGMAWAGFMTNGGFEQNNGAGQLGYTNGTNVVSALGWSSTGYNVLFASGTADTTGSYTQYNNYVKLWGPNNGSANGLTAGSPDGGYFIGSDGAYNVGPLQQTLTGLTVGKTYSVGFWWAGAQQYGYNGATTEQWKVSFGNSTQSTIAASNVNHGFTGWMYQTMNFTADNTSDVLSFLAVGTPNGEPPFSLLDGVTVNAAVPEPSTLVLMGLGLLGVVAARYRQRAKIALV